MIRAKSFISRYSVTSYCFHHTNGNLTNNISTTFLGLYSNDIINSVNKQNNFTFTYNVRVSWFTDE